MSQFKKFTREEIQPGPVKTSIQRAIRKSLLEQYPMLASELEVIMPKKTALVIGKCHDHVSLLIIDSIPYFFQIRDGPWLPTLRTLHQCLSCSLIFRFVDMFVVCFVLDPDILPHYQLDAGALRRILGGAEPMCKGFTSKGGKLPEQDLPAGTPCVRALFLCLWMSESFLALCCFRQLWWRPSRTRSALEFPRNLFLKCLYLCFLVSFSLFG